MLSAVTQKESIFQQAAIVECQHDLFPDGGWCTIRKGVPMKTHAIEISNYLFAVRSRRRAFTLIELLVVIAVILILFGISFKIMVGIGNKTARATVTWKMEQLKNALATYYCVNGCYPPGDTWNKGSFYNSDPMFLGSPSKPICETDGVIFDVGVTNSYPTAVDGFTSMGMPYYLFQDPQAFKWANYLVGVMNKAYAMPTNTVYAGGTTPAGSVQNSYIRFIDEWGQSYHYECSSSNNYQSYRLWSYGPDHTNGTSDDVGFGVQD